MGVIGNIKSIRDVIFYKIAWIVVHFNNVDTIISKLAKYMYRHIYLLNNGTEKYNTVLETAALNF